MPNARRFATLVVAFVCVAYGAGSAGAAGNGGSKLAPVGATQPAAGTKLSDCDLGILGPPGGQEGACQSSNVTLVAADRAHAAALRLVALDVVTVAPIGRIAIGSGSIGPLDPSTKTWIAVKVQVKNTSGKAAAFRDQQINLRLGPTQYQTHPEATSSEPDSLTKANRKIGNGKTITGSVVFEVPTSALGMLTASPTTVLFTGFGGDFAFNQFPGGALGAVHLYK